MTKKINQKGNTILAVIIAIVITALLVGGGVYMWQKRLMNSNNPTKQNNQQINKLDKEQALNGSNEKRALGEGGIKSAGDEIGKNYVGQEKDIASSIVIDVKSNNKNDILNAINNAGYVLIKDKMMYNEEGYKDAEWLSNFNTFLLRKGQKLFRYNKEAGAVFPIKALTIPSGWDVLVERSVTSPDNFFITLVLKKKVKEPSMFEYKIEKVRAYLLENSAKDVINLPDDFASELNQFFSCKIYDSYNKRFFSWYCGEGVGSSSPVTVKNYEGQTIDDALSKSKCFSHKYKNGGLVNITVEEKDGEVLLVANPSKDDKPEQCTRREVYNIKNKLIINN